MEKKIVEVSRRLSLERRLVEFSLTREEWADYSRSPHGGELLVFENFYREALMRDRLMAENLLRVIKETNAKSIVLVTGGFHAAGLKEKLDHTNITTFVPRISSLKTAQRSEYLSVFTREKTPLDKLFAGEKLFLATPPMVAPTALQKLFALRTQVGATVKMVFDRERWTMTKRPDSGVIVAVSVEGMPVTMSDWLTNMFTLSAKWKQGDNDSSFQKIKRKAKNWVKKKAVQKDGIHQRSGRTVRDKRREGTLSLETLGALLPALLGTFAVLSKAYFLPVA
jgi:hypothetical protein